jgi:dTDP-4-dehydrorhamnose reductase
VTTLLLGANGQVGQELLRVLAPLGPLAATTRSGQLADGRACEALDLADSAAIAATLFRLRPARVVNAAAYTAVDRAEDDAEAAWRVNAEVPGEIARWCAQAGVPLVHYSTDYVFDGRAGRPYREDDATGPLNVYGASKLAGEQAIRAAAGRHLIFRTAWVYGARGSNFLTTMLRLARERDSLRVVADQVGTPTPAAWIAETTVRVLQHAGRASGTWHLTAAGQTSWHGFAQAIFEEAVARGILSAAPQVAPIASADYPTRAVRPAGSVLDTGRLQRDFAVVPPPWEAGLAEVMAHHPRV